MAVLIQDHGSTVPALASITTKDYNNDECSHVKENQQHSTRVEMAKKIWVIILCCMALPYLYWYLLISKFTPVHYLQHYAQTFADAFQNSLRRSVLFERGQHNSSVTSGADVTGSNDVPNSEDIIKQPLKNGSKDETEDEEEGAVDSDKIDSPANGKKKDSARIPLKKILIWNKNFGLGSGRSAFLRFGCKYNACTVTNKTRNFVRYERTGCCYMARALQGQKFSSVRNELNMFSWYVTGNQMRFMHIIFVSQFTDSQVVLNEDILLFTAVMISLLLIQHSDD
ncbi:uncharacterized protein LOC135200663 [Macrobrachium nipponense]|uniref:uncharacterized protein LOC135200663 n=1 Tax=Macrobrachium nipponense TaxID=159736 RepID=UPI0030C8BD21